MNIQDYADRDMLAIDLANVLADELNDHLHTHPRASLAVAGGSSPGPMFDALCAAEVHWERVSVLPTDERFVPQDHPRSNAAMIQSRLLVNRAASARFLPLFAPADAPEDVLPELEAMLSPEMPISVLVLGMGTDMHTASLFPGAPGLTQALDPHAPLLSVLRPADQPEARISLSARVLDAAVSKHLIIFGAEKRAALEKAMSLPPQEAPVRAILKDTTIHWAE